jgi:hypothetical protein
MEIKHWLSALPADSKKELFYGEEKLLADYSILQMIASEQKEITSAFIEREIAKVESKTAHDRSYWIFSSVGPEPNSSIARYYKGSRNSFLLGRKNSDEFTYENSYIKEGEIWWYGMHKIGLSEFDRYLEYLFGYSGSLVLFTNQRFDLALMSLEIFEAIWMKRKNMGQIRNCICDIIQAIPVEHKFGFINGYGSEDFGGFFINTYLPRH